MENHNDNHKYDDIINLPHHQSQTRVHMSLYDRAAQFSPFAALTGYDDAVKESARLTDKKQELSDEAVSQLNAKLLFIKEHIKNQPEITVTYFVPDEKKDGGTYITEKSAVKRIDDFERVIILKNNAKIPFDNISDIEGEIFRDLYDEF
ncbi:MAG: hypothetical protein ACI4GV_07865 [Acutalibacteraceae bacterium]